MIDDLSLHIADLLLNALRAGARHIGLRLEKGAGELVLEVVDDGKGMTESELERALDPFFTTKGDPQGVGLGLALVKQTAEELAGELVVDSAPGRGTKVRLSIPYSHPDRPPVGDFAGTLAPLILANPGVEFTIVLADDGRTWTLSPEDIAALGGGRRRCSIWKGGCEKVSAR